ncbi:HEPN domain-containing protein [Roseiarcus sp.]|uniref:HEPN domain-containing protein n=1 Tax=Roseiarcus sp. TaxID=1969460 RepID=UPI003F98ACD9
MKPQSGAFLEKARELVVQAETMHRVGLNDDAGRTAYLAGLHAAQAFLFEKHGRVFKKHATVQGEFGRLVKDNTDFDLELRAFLGRSYQLKAIADYEAGPGIGVSAARAAEAITVARRFLQTIESLIRP